MVVYVMRWEVLPEKKEAYTEWSQGAIGRTLGAPGVVEFRVYRPASGTSQVVVTYEFASLADWTAWYENQGVQDVLEELHLQTTNFSSDIWGPSPVVPEPIRPGG